MEDTVTSFVAGVLSAGYAVSALFFARFWRDTQDRLFGFFTVAFALLALQRTALALAAHSPAASTGLYGVRLVAFLLILYAIIDKNRSVE